MAQALKLQVKAFLSQFMMIQLPMLRKAHPGLVPLCMGRELCVIKGSTAHSLCRWLAVSTAIFPSKFYWPFLIYHFSSRHTKIANHRFKAAVTFIVTAAFLSCPQKQRYWVFYDNTLVFVDTPALELFRNKIMDNTALAPIINVKSSDNQSNYCSNYCSNFA